MRSYLYCAVIALSLSVNAHASSTFRCSSKLVSLQASTFEVLTKCGQPTERSLLGETERLDEYGYRIIVSLEEWVYGPINGMYYFLRFEGEQLSSIKSKRRQ